MMKRTKRRQKRINEIKNFLPRYNSHTLTPKPTLFNHGIKNNKGWNKGKSI